MRILLVTPYFYPAEAFGGPVKVAFDVGKELVKRGHEIVVFTSDARDLQNRLSVESDEVEGMRVHYFRNLSMFFVKWSKLFITPDLSKKMKSDLKSFDVVHAHEYRTYQNIVVHKFAEKYGVPYILQVHGSLPKRGRLARKWFYDAFFGSRLLRDASKVIALSSVEVEQYRDMGVPKEKIEIIPNGIDLSEYNDLPPKGSFKKKFGISGDQKIVLYVGRIHKSKGLDLLAQAFKIVSKDVNNVRLVVVGPDDGGYAAEFSRLISHLGIEAKVLFTGFVDKRVKLAAFVDGDVFATPCFSGFPVTFLEACLAGCPIITASDELDWIDNNVGYVTEYSSNALAKAISSVLQDEQVNRKFRNNSRHTIKKFGISTITRQVEEIYNDINRCYTYFKL